MNALLNYTALKKALQEKQLQPAYLIYGEETALIDDVTRELVEAFLGTPEKEINYFIRYATETPLQALVPLWGGGSLFSEKKVVEYRDFQAVKSKKLDPLLAYLKQPNPDVLLILQVRDAVLPRFVQKIQSLISVVEINTLDSSALERLILQEAKNKGKTIEPEAVKTFLFYVGNQLQDIRLELVQLFNYYEQQETIRVQDVEDFVRQRPTKTVFDFTRALGEKNKKMAFNYLHQLIERGESPFSILFHIQRTLLLMWKIKGYALDKTYTEREVQKALGLYSRHYQEYRHQASRWKWKELQDALRIVKDTDGALKSSQMAPELLLDILLGRLINLI